jgi:hypothetical protein
MNSIAILDNAHQIIDVAASKLVGVVDKNGRCCKNFARRLLSTPLYGILDTLLASDLQP